MERTDALIIAHGQPSETDRAETDLARLAARVQAGLPGWRLSSATMAAPGQLEAEMKRMAPGGVIYPLFMSDGWFVRTALLGRVGAAPVEVMPPFGMESDLPHVVADALNGQGSNTHAPKTLLLAAHGSASGRRGPARSAHDFARSLECAMPGVEVKVAFLEQFPGISEVLLGCGDALCLPFLAADGYHMRQDVRDALALGGFSGQILPVISQFPGVDAMIARAIRDRPGRAVAS
ncbi:MAG: cobalamin biosynthesis protein CbiX [Rhodobacteraceae bacterium]|nr:cobalamin biosynthesis protein CbiX [Paracoccaceae bacterium]